jgi:hypothetical protein
MLLDPALRVIGHVALGEPKGIFDFMARLPDPGSHAGTALHAPVLIAPRVFEAEMRQRLIALHEATGGKFSGVMRDAGDRTVMVMDELKKRRDVLVEDLRPAGGAPRAAGTTAFPADQSGASASPPATSNAMW